MNIINLLVANRAFCYEPGVTKVMYFLGILLFIAKIVIPIGLIVLGTIDISKAVISNDDAAIKKEATALAKRAVIGVAIFFIPMIVQFALSLIYNYTETESASVNCMNCLLKPTSYSDSKSCSASDKSCFLKRKDICIRSIEDYNEPETCGTYIRVSTMNYNNKVYEYDKTKKDNIITTCIVDGKVNNSCIIKSCFKKARIISSSVGRPHKKSQEILK